MGRNGSQCCLLCASDYENPQRRVGPMLLQIAAKACGLDVHDVHEFFVSLTSGQPAESVEIEDFIHHAMRPGVFEPAALTPLDTMYDMLISKLSSFLLQKCEASRQCYEHSGEVHCLSNDAGAIRGWHPNGKCAYMNFQEWYISLVLLHLLHTCFDFFWNMWLTSWRLLCSVNFDHCDQSGLIIWY